MSKDRIDHEWYAESADRAAEKAEQAGNPATAAFMSKIARAHRAVAKDETK